MLSACVYAISVFLRVCMASATHVSVRVRVDGAVTEEKGFPLPSPPLPLYMLFAGISQETSSSSIGSTSSRTSTNPAASFSRLPAPTASSRASAKRQLFFKYPLYSGSHLYSKSPSYRGGKDKTKKNIRHTVEVICTDQVLHIDGGKFSSV